MANVGFYDNRLKQLMSDPGAFEGTPGFAFARAQGLKAVQSSNSARRGSGNVLAALTKYATGLAQQDYGNEVDRNIRALGGEQQYDLGQVGNQNQATQIANSFKLGTEQNANTRDANDQQFGLGMYRAGNDYALGREQNANTAERGWLDYDIARRRDALDTATAENNWNLAGERNDIDWFGANTARGNARSNDYYRGEENRRAWRPYGSGY